MKEYIMEIMHEQKESTEHPEKVNRMCLNCGKFGGECQGTTEKVWTGCIYKKPKDRLEKATENFVAVRDHFLNEGRGTSQAYRMAFKKPMKFYHEHTPAEAVEILKREAEEN